MRKGVDEPLEKPTEEPVDISKRLIEVRQELVSAQDDLAKLTGGSISDEMPIILAKERVRLAERSLILWEKKSS